MAPEELPHYCWDVRAEAKKSSIPIHLGFECEWAPRYESWYRDELLGEQGADYLVFGSHWLLEGKTTLYAAELRSREEIRRYFDFTIQGIQSGLYAFLAHPDLIMAGGMEWNNELAAGFSAIIDAANDCRMPIEINGYGMIKARVSGEWGKRFQYPVDEFWRLAAEKNATVICNSDAHSPDFVMQGVEKTREYAAKFGITPIDTIFK
jgi:histidinol-phosphatase (PHP family)